MEVILGMEINVKVKLVLSFLMEVARHVQDTQNRKLVIFLQYIKTNCRNCFVFYSDAKHLDVLRGFSHVHYYLFKIFSNCLHFCPNFQIFCLLLAFCPFFAFSLQNCTHGMPYFLEKALDTHLK